MLFQTCTSDPTNKTQRKLNKMLLDLRKAGKMSDSTYKMLFSCDSLCIRFYGLPKIHKLGIPLRPIVSFVNSPTYAISGYLARILSPVVGNTDYTVKNSCEFADFIRDKTLNAYEELVSFDVVSLLTKAEERKYASNVVKANGYTKTLATGFAVIPYIQGVTKPIKRILNSHNVKVAQKPF